MKIVSLTIEGAYKISPNVLGDNRGRFARVYCSQTFEAQGLNTNWVQMNTSFSAREGTVRGLHFQRPPCSEVKLVRCVRGEIVDFILDLRRLSPTFGHAISVPVSSQGAEMLYIPQGCAHGFQTLTDDVELHYCHSEFYSPEHEGGVSILDPDLQIELPLPVSEMSDRDKQHATFINTRPIEL